MTKTLSQHTPMQYPLLENVFLFSSLLSHPLRITYPQSELYHPPVSPLVSRPLSGILWAIHCEALPTVRYLHTCSTMFCGADQYILP